MALLGPLERPAHPQALPVPSADPAPAASSPAPAEAAPAPSALDAGTSPPLAPVTGAVPLHVGIFDPNTPSARTLAGDVARLAGRQARQRKGLTVTQDALDTWLTEAHFRHEAAVLTCMDPWRTRREVLNCLQLLPFPAMPGALPAGTRFVLDGMVTTLEPGLVVTVSLHPVVDGWAGPPVLTREVTVTRRMRRPARDAALVRLLEDVLDAAEGKPPAERGRRKGGAR